MNRHQRRGEPTGHGRTLLWAMIGFPLVLWLLAQVAALVRH